MPPWGVVSQRALGCVDRKLLPRTPELQFADVYFYIRESLRRIDTLVKSANLQHLLRAWAVELLKREVAQQRTKSLRWHFGVTSEITGFSVHLWVGPFSPVQTRVHTGVGVLSTGLTSCMAVSAFRSYFCIACLDPVQQTPCLLSLPL